MEILTNIIVEYLKHNKRLCVPKLGTFIVKQSSGDIIFSDLMRNDDGVLRSLLMASGVKELEASGIIDRYVFEVRHAISSEGRMVIDGFGEFSADRNNTITFVAKHTVTPRPQPVATESPKPKSPKPKSPKQGYKGRVKPPVEILEERKVPKLSDRQDLQAKRGMKQGTKSQRIEEEENITLGKPDAYLRGLKYDSKKNKKREESGHSDRAANPRIKWVIIGLIVAIAAVAVALLWPKSEGTTSQPTASTSTIEVRDTSTIESALLIDSLEMGSQEITNTATLETNNAE